MFYDNCILITVKPFLEQQKIEVIEGNNTSYEGYSKLDNIAETICYLSRRYQTNQIKIKGKNIPLAEIIKKDLTSVSYNNTNFDIEIF